MNITKETTGELTATIRMEISPADYQEVVLKKLKEYQRKANIPGFRPGKVPPGLIRKMYGKAVMAEEIKTLISENLSSYLTDQKLDLLGNPLPNKEKIHPAKFEDGESFIFHFDIGLSPQINLLLGPGLTVKKYLIKVDDKMVDDYIRELQKQNGTFSSPETPGPGDMISADATEVDADEHPVDSGFRKNLFIYPDKITLESARTKLMDLHKDDLLVISPGDFFGSAEEAARMLNLPGETIAKPGLTLALKCTHISHNEPAELNTEFFTKVFPGKGIENEADFREQVRTDAAASFSRETDKLLFHEAIDLLGGKTEVKLPDQFLKRWMREHDDNKLPEEEIEKQYPSFSRSMKWQLIENKLIKDNLIEVKEEDIRNYIRTNIFRQVNREFTDPDMAQKYESIVDTFMQNKEQVQKINDQLFSAKLLEVFKEKLTLDPVEVTYEEFLTLASAKNNHKHE